LKDEEEILRHKHLLQDRIQSELCDARPIESVHAVALINAPLKISAMRKPENWVYVAASALANELFGRDRRLTGLTLRDFYSGCKDWMTARDFKAFHKEQRTLVAAAVAAMEADEPDDVVVATVPMVIAAHEIKEFRGRAYLPTIVSTVLTEHVMQIKVLYLEVTSIVQQDTENGGGYRCPIKPGCAELIQEVIALKKKEMTTGPGGSGRKPVVFLCYNRRNVEHVRIVYNKLRDVGVEPWLDEQNIGPGDDSLKSIAKVIHQCRAAIVFIDQNEVDGVQGREITCLIGEKTRRSRSIPGRRLSIVPVLLPGAQIQHLELLEQDQGVQFELISDDWIKQFVTRIDGVDPGDGERVHRPGNSR
jgi:hypothetical protein